jgi:ABC-2 type transport system ATP-binding protein
MRQRLALAGALLGDPEVLLLDEPANGLDPDGIRWLRTYLRDFADRGGTVFVSSHLISELAMFADDLVVIGGGKLLAAKSLDEIAALNDAQVVVETADSAELIALLSAEGAAVDTVGRHLMISGTTRTHVSQLAFDNRIQLTELTDTVKSLEDTLIDMTEASAEFAAA